MGLGGAVHYAPAIPPDKERGARAAHAAHLPESEPILVLYDATILGAADNGFVVTAARLCWKTLFDHPRQIAWSDLDPASVRAREDAVTVAGGTITVYGDLPPNAAAFFVEMAAQARAPDAGPYRRTAESGAGAPEGAPFDVPRLVALARQHLGEVEDVFYHPAIPPAKLRKARAVHALSLDADEVVAVLYDDTLFGSAEEGFLLTPTRLAMKSVTTLPESLPWREIDPTTIAPSGIVVHVMKGILMLTSRRELVVPVATLLTTLAREARRERG
jgi:hypothetical protein